MGQKKNRVGAYVEKPFVRITYIYVYANHRIVKNAGWALTWDITVHVHVCKILFASKQPNTQMRIGYTVIYMYTCMYMYMCVHVCMCMHM